VLDAESQIKQARLRLAGEEEKAQEEALKHRYARQIEEAQKAANAELAARLKTLRDLELEELRRQHADTGSAKKEAGRLALSVDPARFLQHATGFREDKGVTEAKEQTKVLKSIFDRGRKQEVYLQQIAEKLPQFTVGGGLN